MTSASRMPRPISPDLTSDGKTTPAVTPKIFVESSTVRLLAAVTDAS